MGPDPARLGVCGGGRAGKSVLSSATFVLALLPPPPISVSDPLIRSGGNFEIFQ